MSDWEEDDLFLTQNSFSGLLNVHGKLEEMLEAIQPGGDYINVQSVQGRRNVFCIGGGGGGGGGANKEVLKTLTCRGFWGNSPAESGGGQKNHFYSD